MESLQIGNKIKKLRELRNFTQDYMAEALQMSQAGYGKIERDETDISLSRLQQIASVLKVGLNDLIGFDDKLVFYGAMHNHATANGGFSAKKILITSVSYTKGRLSSWKSR